MKTQLIKSLEYVFEDRTLKLEKEDKITGPKGFTPRLYIHCASETPHQVYKNFHRPHSTAYNLVPYITLTKEAFEALCSSVCTSRVNTTDSASIDVLFVDHNKVEIRGVGSYGSYCVLWRGSPFHVIDYFNNHHSPTATHSTYHVEFHGRKSGSIGITYDITLELSIPVFEQRDIKAYLYDIGFEHLNADPEVMEIAYNPDINYRKEL